MLSGFASRPWLIIPICSALHLTYALGLWLDKSVYKITALHFSAALFGLALPYVLSFVALLAMYPMVARRKDIRPEEVHLYMWPQQLMLFLMTVAAITASFQGVYPDGYIANSIFIMADQSFALWLMLGHLAAMIRNARFKQ